MVMAFLSHEDSGGARDAPRNRPARADIPIHMLSMRALLKDDPFLPVETRERIARGDCQAHGDLVRLGVDDCEAAELLDHPREECGDA
jgi:hypothetical protein